MAEIGVTYQDVVRLASLAADRYRDQPVRADLPGQPVRPLTQDEEQRCRQALAWLDAVANLLASKGFLKDNVTGPLAEVGERRSVWEE